MASLLLLNGQFLSNGDHVRLKHFPTTEFIPQESPGDSSTTSRGRVFLELGYLSYSSPERQNRNNCLIRGCIPKGEKNFILYDKKKITSLATERCSEVKADQGVSVHLVRYQELSRSNSGQ